MKTALIVLFISLGATAPLVAARASAAVAPCDRCIYGHEGCREHPPATSDKLVKIDRRRIELAAEKARAQAERACELAKRQAELAGTQAAEHAERARELAERYAESARTQAAEHGARARELAEHHAQRAREQAERAQALAREHMAKALTAAHPGQAPANLGVGRLHSLLSGRQGSLEERVAELERRLAELQGAHAGPFAPLPPKAPKAVKPPRFGLFSPRGAPPAPEAGAPPGGCCGTSCCRGDAPRALLEAEDEECDEDGEDDDCEDDGDEEEDEDDGDEEDGDETEDLLGDAGLTLRSLALNVPALVTKAQALFPGALARRDQELVLALPELEAMEVEGLLSDTYQVRMPREIVLDVGPVPSEESMDELRELIDEMRDEVESLRETLRELRAEVRAAREEDLR